jgi:hypothetical protein
MIRSQVPVYSVLRRPDEYTTLDALHRDNCHVNPEHNERSTDDDRSGATWSQGRDHHDDLHPTSSTDQASV